MIFCHVLCVCGKVTESCMDETTVLLQFFASVLTTDSGADLKKQLDSPEIMLSTEVTNTSLSDSIESISK